MRCSQPTFTKCGRAKIIAPASANFSCAVLHNWLSNGRMKAPPNIVKLRLDGFPLDALDQKRMRRLRRTSDQMGVPIPDLIREIVGQMIDAWIAEAELPHKIVKFPVAGRSRG